jgi:hypothetical protein
LFILKQSVFNNINRFKQQSLLIHSIRERFFENLATQYPNHVINIRKQDLLNIKTFSYNGFASELNLSKCSTYLSNLETLSKNSNILNSYFTKPYCTFFVFRNVSI